jgi:phage FluMu protein Com
MSIESTCPNCNKRLKAAAGAKVACPGCKTIFRMPMPPPEPPAAPAPAPAEMKEAMLELDHLPAPSEIRVEDKPAPPLPAESDEIYDAVLEGSPPPMRPDSAKDADEPAAKKKRRRQLYEDEIECPECGTVNHEDDSRCRKCDARLHGRPRGRRRSSESDGGLDSLIPYKNAWALWSYYLSVFSLIPCIAIPLGLAALITGIKGLSYANEHPKAKGKAHAWVGIILGGLCLLGNVSFIVFLVWAGSR